MKLNDVFPSNYLKADDLNNREIKVRVREYKIEKLGEEQKLVLYFFKTDKGMVCNKTNASLIATVLGDNLDDWIGNELTLGTELVTYQGKASKAIRVKNASFAAPTAAPAPTVELPNDETPF